jgi:iron complex transport system substrate-binding protein
VWCNVNVDTAMANAFYIGKIVYPDKFEDLDPIKKANEIYKFLVGREVYDELVKDEFGGFQQVTLEDLEANKFFKAAN